MFLAAVLPGGHALAQSPDADIEAVQRKLDAAKQAQAAKDAAAKREADQRAAAQAAERRQRDAAAAAEAQKGTMIVKSDTRCELSVNGETQGWLEAEATQRVKVDAGEQLIECNAGDGRKIEQTEEIDSGKQSVVRLTMPSLERFSRVADGIADRDQQLIWASADNGSDINWGDAGRYCAGKGSGWTLPSVAALQSLYDASGAHGFSWTSPRTGTVYTVKPATSLIRLSSCCSWSNESNGSSEAWGVFLYNGTRNSGSVVTAGARALCVRRS
jgi:hypothetical protein